MISEKSNRIVKKHFLEDKKIKKVKKKAIRFNKKRLL